MHSTDRPLAWPPDWRAIEVDQTGNGGGHCDCCGSLTKRVWGFVHFNHGTVAAYFIAWTHRKPDHGANFDLIIGRWGEASNSRDRYSVAVDYRLIDGRGQFMVVDARNRLVENELVGATLDRSEVIGTPLAAQVFAIVDAVFMSDGAQDIREWSEP